MALFDPVLRDHVNSIRVSQDSGKRLQAHYLSKDIQNEIISLCGDFVRDTIVRQITKTKYFAISVDGTPDVSHKEQLSFIVRYIRHTSDESIFFIEERFLSFENFSKKQAKKLPIKS